MSTLKLGWASRDISTDKPAFIPGQAHMRVSKGVLHPLTATALVVDDGNDSVIFLTIDAVHVYPGLLDMIREKTKALNSEIPVEKIISTATHAHTGTGHHDDWERPIERYTKAGLIENPDDFRWDLRMDTFSFDDCAQWLSAILAETVAEAWDKRAEGGIAYGYGYAVVAHSRRVCYFDDLSLRPGVDKSNSYAVNGHAAMYGNTNDDNFSHYEAGADHFINLMYTFDPEGNLTGAIVNVPCPSQNSEGEWYLTSDYWHDVRLAIREKFGDIFILPQCAAAGDLAPRTMHYRAAQARRFKLKYEDCEADSPANAKHELYARKDIAERIAAAFEEVYSWARKDIKTDVKVAHKVTMMELERYMITDEDLTTAKEGLAAQMAKPMQITDDPVQDLIENSKTLSNRFRFMGVIQRSEDQKVKATIPTEVHVLHIGDVAFASNPFELYMDFQHRIQARSPFEQTFIVQLCGQPNGAVSPSYLCTERAFEGRGYSAIVYSIQVSHVGGQTMVDETVKQLKELYEEK